MNKDKKLRAYNIIWDFAKDYSFTPINYYDNYYKNIIYGIIIKNFNIKIIVSFLKYLSGENPYYDDLKNLTYLVFEDLSYKIIKEKSLTIKNLRINYAKDKIKHYKQIIPNNIYEQIENIYYEKDFNLVPKESHYLVDFYNELFRIKSLETVNVIDHLNKVYEKYFRFEKSKNDKSMLDKMLKENKEMDFKRDVEFNDNLVLEQFGIGSAEFTSNIYFEKKEKQNNKNILFFEKEDDNIKDYNSYLSDLYGKSYVRSNFIKNLEKDVSIGIHKNKFLYFTKGVYRDNPNARFYEKMRDKQKEKNLKYTNDNLAITNRSIKKLQQSIKNSMQKNMDEDFNNKNYGLLDSSLIWKAEYLNYDKIFYKKENDYNNKFRVNLLLDSSASQIKRQHIVANQAYIIAKSMDNANIPIRIFGYQTLKDHTIFTKLRDYKDKDNNENIFNFFASGSNRDGLVFKTINKLIEMDKKDYKDIVIILSDGKPNDEKIDINVKKGNQKPYKDKIAVDDSAKEIRNLKEKGISILGVFTGKDEDVKNAKLIYGQNFCHIKNITNFSEIVSVFMKNEILK